MISIHEEYFTMNPNVGRLVEILRTLPKGKSARKVGIIKKNMTESEKVKYRLRMTDPNIIMERRCIFCGHYYLMRQFMESQY